MKKCFKIKQLYNYYKEFFINDEKTYYSKDNQILTNKSIKYSQNWFDTYYSKLHVPHFKKTKYSQNWFHIYYPNS